MKNLEWPSNKTVSGFPFNPLSRSLLPFSVRLRSFCRPQGFFTDILTLWRLLERPTARIETAEVVNRFRRFISICLCGLTALYTGSPPWSSCSDSFKSFSHSKSVGQ